MKKHHGMRPHDLAILLKIAAKGDQQWYMKDLAYELGISAGEVSESLNRSAYAGLISKDKRSLNKLALFDFLTCGLPYVFPQQPGALARGIKTAHSAFPLSGKVSGEEVFIWPYAKGDSRGQSVEPLHPNIPEACLKDSIFYEYMALADAIRIGKARERQLAVDMIKKKLKDA